MSEHTKATASDYAVSYGDWTLWVNHRPGAQPSIEVRRQFTQKVAAALNAADETERLRELLRRARAWATDLEAMGVEICPADIETIADIYAALAD